MTRGMMPAAGRAIDAERVLQLVGRAYHVTPSQIKSPQRQAYITIARHVCMYLLRRAGGRTLEEIGEVVGYRDHTTVVHGVQRVEQAIQSDQSFRVLVEWLGAQCSEGVAPTLGPP